MIVDVDDIAAKKRLPLAIKGLPDILHPVVGDKIVGDRPTDVDVVADLKWSDVVDGKPVASRRDILHEFDFVVGSSIAANFDVSAVRHLLMTSEHNL